MNECSTCDGHLAYRNWKHTGTYCGVIDKCALSDRIQDLFEPNSAALGTAIPGSSSLLFPCLQLGQPALWLSHHQYGRYHRGNGAWLLGQCSFMVMRVAGSSTVLLSVPEGRVSGDLQPISTSLNIRLSRSNWLRASVLAVTISDTAQVILVCASAYRQVVKDWGNPTAHLQPSQYSPDSAILIASP